MCQVIEIEGTGRTIETMGGLRRTWPNLVPRRFDRQKARALKVKLPIVLSRLHDDVCLCLVDVVASGRANGAEVVPVPGRPGHYSMLDPTEGYDP